MTKHSQNISARVMQLADEYIKSEKEIKIKFSEYATQKTGYHYGHLCRDFKINIGVTIGIYIAAKKIMLAKEMIRNDPDINFKEIADKLSYSDAAHFHNSFTNMTGVRPLQYKNEIKEKIYGSKQKS